MSQIKVARYSGVKYEFVDGYARVPVLEGEFDQAHFAHCALQPGCSITPEVYSVTEHNQLFIFTKGKGYVTTPRQAWNINEPGVFVPEFDSERFTITCSADSKEPLEIRLLAMKALLRLETPEAQEALDRILREEPKGPDREAFQSLLAEAGKVEAARQA